MELSYKILTVKGISIELHLFFIMFVLAFLLVDPTITLMLAIVFFFVALHEIMHSIVAINHGIKVKRIMLLPIGGIAFIEKSEMKPMIEIKMALAGPLFNFLMVYICLLVAYIFQLPLADWIGALFAGNLSLPLPETILFYIFYANAMLGYFNLLVPAFPLDGGRIFRAALALVMPYEKATNIAKKVSLVIAAFLFVLGMYASAYWHDAGGIWYMIIAAFIAFGALAEYETMMTRHALGKIKLADLISKQFITVQPKESVATAVERMLAMRCTTALVEGKTVKIIDLPSIAAVPRTKWGSTDASKLARSVGHVSIHTSVELAVKKMTEQNTGMMPVVDGNQLAGVVYRSDIEKMARILEILGK
jgi:Zn-dependent protease